MVAEADGEKAQLIAVADGEKASYLAKADGEKALAEALEMKAKAYQELDKAGVQQMILDKAPQLGENGKGQIIKEKI